MTTAAAPSHGLDTASRPGLRRGVRFSYDAVRGEHALLFPEGVLLLNESAAAVLSRCDGATVEQITEALAATYDGVSTDDVIDLLADLVRRRLVTVGDDGTPVAVTQPRPEAPGPAGSAGPAARSTPPPSPPVPSGMLAEITYRCPLRCAYCSNPLELMAYRAELPTADWLRVLEQARAAGVLQVHFSGGEPLLRPDLPELVSAAHRLGMYTNLITSGIPLDERRLAALVDAGLEHVQLSIQDSDPAAADAMAGIRAYDKKLVAAGWIRATGVAFTVNAVLHAGNLDRLSDIADLGMGLGADRLELANTQYYGWGFRNRAALMPSPEQVERARGVAAEIQARYPDAEIVYVAADYHDDRPKPCMNGWGSRLFVVAPNGDMLPCLAAAQLPDLGVRKVTEASVADIWYASSAFNRFRGTDWMPSPCRDCALKEIDFGGCRCQAYQLTGDPTATDPACGLSPHHDLVRRPAVAATEPAGPVRRDAVPRRMR